MSGPSSRRLGRLLVAVQVTLIAATLFAPISASAADDPSADPEPTPSTEPTPTPGATPEPAPVPTPAAPPAISSDKDDYAPGELVTLSGTSWASGEAVHVFVNDDAGSTWSRHSDVVADEGGAITDAFNLPTWFVAVYSVTATGSVSGTAITGFTDARLVTTRRSTAVRR